MKEEKQNDLLHMLLSKMVHCGGRGGATGAKVLLSVPLYEENNTFAQSGGLLVWFGAKEYLLMAKIFKKLSRRRQFSIQFRGVHLMDFVETQKGSDEETGCFGWWGPLHSVFVQMIVG